ncbi:MAG: hypothetical protein IPL61_11295 [Myxococcales bacterium]|nr:hypothetical protein [Myxococcales bacterium]
MVGWRQRDVRATELGPGPITPSDDEVTAALAAAAARGLAATVFPIVVLDVTGPGQWRGTLAPTDVDAWWSAYERFILHYAALAAAHDAAALVVGSELGSTEHWRERWYHLIGRARRAFTGRLLYSANWDHWREVSFWPRLDAVGVTGYFELAQRDDADVATLAAAWRAARTELRAGARQHGKPLWLTEVGYVARDGATRAPWDYLRATAIDLEEQRRAFAALAAAWAGDDVLAGLFVWEWSGAGGADDGGYTLRGKPARCELAAWYGARE